MFFNKITIKKGLISDKSEGSVYTELQTLKNYAFY